MSEAMGLKEQLQQGLAGGMYWVRVATPKHHHKPIVGKTDVDHFLLFVFGKEVRLGGGSRLMSRCGHAFLGLRSLGSTGTRLKAWGRM